MHRLFLLTHFLLSGLIIQAQSFKTLVYKDSAGIKSFKYYGEMNIKGTFLKSNLYGAYGGKVGFLLNNKMAFGGAWHALFPASFSGNDRSTPTPTKLNFTLSAAGFFANYSLKQRSPVHLSFPINFTIGKISITDNTGRSIESASAYLIEPEINIDFNFSKILIISVTTGYRFAKATKLINFSNQDLGGLTFGLIGKFSNF